MHKKLIVWLFIGVFGITNLGIASAPDTLWTRTYGGTKVDYGRSVKQTKDGGFIIVGTTYSFGVNTPTYSNVYLIKTNSTGETLWTRTYGGIYDDEGYSVQQTPDEGFIIAGWTCSFGAGYADIYLLKTDSSGDTLWTKTYGGTGYDYGNSIQQTLDGGFIVTGFTNSFGAGSNDGYIIRTNFSGDTLWTRTFSGGYNDYCGSAQQTQDSGFIIVGSLEASDDNVYLVKTNSSGNTLWTKIFGGTADDAGTSIQQTEDSGFIITGHTYSFGTGGKDVYMIKTNSSGDTLWTRTFGGTADDYGSSVQQTQDGGFIIAGYTYSFGWNGYLIRTNSSGDTLWTKTVGETNWDGRWAVQQTEDGGFIIAGSTSSFGIDSSAVYLVRLAKEVGIEEKWSEATSRLGGDQKLNIKIGQNPFITSTSISYSVPYYTSTLLTNTQLTLYDLSGQCVKTLINEQKPAGTYTTTLNSKNLTSGVYFIKLSTNNYTITKKIVLMK
ncbi:MAG: T9SS type A sorting domain-containing protein [bacterium]|nr:T9SS type A sorting domain-containing protein [bacterium]